MPRQVDCVLKLYGMVGIPGEEPADVDQTVAMIDIKKAARITLDTGMQHVCSQSAHAVSVAWGESAAEKRLWCCRNNCDRIDFRPKVTTGQSFRLYYPGRSPLIPTLELTRHYGDSPGSYRRAFKQLRGNFLT